ncbi:MAG: hypothetical protein JWP12_879 [Bacteroidetes bacterium]|nr:hypothetical protein [Bacteroidota bacterium]
MKTIYNERLIHYADHLATIKDHAEHGIYRMATLTALEKKLHTSYIVKTHNWCYEELPMIFDEWGYDEFSGDAILLRMKPQEGTIAGVIDFFDMTLKEFCHVFDLDGLQDIEQYGGILLTPDSDGADIAYNIIELVRGRENAVVQMF